MKKISLIVTGFILAFSLNGLAQKVTVDFDKNTDFSKYTSFSFLGWQEDINKVANELDQKRIKDAFNAEMINRNLEMVDNGGDMAIALYIVIDQKTSTTAYTNYYGGGAGRGYGRGGWGWGGGHATTTYSESDYLEGTFVLSIFDEGSKDLVWQGVATKTIKENPQKREKSIPKSVSKLMKKFPIEPVE